MKKLTTLALAMVALFALVGTSAWAQSGSVTVTLSPQNNSGQAGTAVLQDMGNGTTKVTVNISGGSAVAQPAHIHDGPCATLNPKPKYPLTSLVNGTSETIVNEPLSDLADGTYAINVHKSATEASVYVACGNIEKLVVAGMPQTGSSDSILPAFALAALGLVLASAGWKLSRRQA
jgi:LPXTG-motif cell wall-anchored protein